MEPRATNKTPQTTPIQSSCDCCEDQPNALRLKRRDFLSATGGLVLGSTALGSMLPGSRAFAQNPTGLVIQEAVKKMASQPETLVKVLFDTLSPKQRENICFDWEHRRRRARPAANARRQQLGHHRILRQRQQLLHQGSAKDHPRDLRRHHQPRVALADRQAAGRRLRRLRRAEQHRDLRHARQREVRVRDDRPAHDDPLRRQLRRPRRVRRTDLLRPRGRWHSTRRRTTRATSSGRRPWQRTSSTRCSTASSRSRRCVKKGMPTRTESRLPRQGRRFPRACRSANCRATRKSELQNVMAALVEPYRQSDRDEVTECLKKQGGLDACHLAYYASERHRQRRRVGQLAAEGPSFVWHYRGAPHVHVWVNVADDPSVKLNA